MTDAVPRDLVDPELLTPEERIAEVARILAEGYLRARARRVEASESRSFAMGTAESAAPLCPPENDLEAPEDQSVPAPVAGDPARWWAALPAGEESLR